MSDINSFKEKLQNLIIKFEKDKHHYLSKDYLEAQVRQDFINPFFEALGWDIENKKGLSPFDREVILEKGETTGRPDYNFRISGSTKFFVEAKAPSVILDNVHHILQAKTYAWSTKEVYFVILTDFEGFKLFDASLKPSHKFPGEGLIFDFRYTEYLENIDKLWLLSIEEVEKGSLEKLLPRDVKSKRLRIPVDKAFLLDMTEWRTGLAKDIHKRNPSLDVRLLNEVVQRLLDRVIFIRIAEDRKIRNPYELKEIVDLWRHENKRKPILTHLNDLFREVNDDLNGDIFKPHACETIDVDSDLLSDIIENFYFPKCRYRFDVIGVELLGSIYERYLGSTIRVTPQRVKVEEKLEVRKAGGVYYTPKYIVDYIVKNTVGRLIEGKTPKQIEKLKILDPACGSGSFLLGAYQYLLNYHLEYFRKHPKEAQNLSFDFYQKVSPEDLSLPLRTKARILKNNIFGVDLDAQAVEITMMSLYLKALEGERSILPKKQQLLPSLTNNIKCGNSLIGYDFFEQHELFNDVGEGLVPSRRETTRVSPTIPDDIKSRINPFDWNSKSAGFGEIMNPSYSPLEKGGSKGGFDVVIGNPPYGADYEKGILYYLSNLYNLPITISDSYLMFILQGLKLIKKDGLLGYIVPSTWLYMSQYQNFRNKLLKELVIKKVLLFREPVFQKVTVETCITLIANSKPSSNTLYYFKEITGEPSNFSFKSISEKQSKLSSEIESNLILASSDVEKNLFNRLARESMKLKDVALIVCGLTPYRKGKGKPPQSAKIIESKAFDADYQKDKTYRKYLMGRDFNRYAFQLKKERWISYGDWLAEPRYKAPFNDEKKIVVRQTADTIIAHIDKEKNLSLKNVHNIRITFNNLSYEYLLGLLNSKLLGWWYQHLIPEKGRVFAEVKVVNLKKLPIRTIDFNKPSEKVIHDKLVSLVDRMLELHKKKNSLPPSAEREKVEREIAVTDEKIDEIVYGLYGVTDGERKIIEGK